MGNLLQYTDKSKTIDAKINTMLAQLEYEKNNGLIKTEVEYYYKLRNMLNEFYLTLNKPTFKYRPAISTPMSSEYNAMINESVNDMEYLIKDCENLKNLVSQSFSDADLSRTMLKNSINQLTQQINSLTSSISTNQLSNAVIFTELFSDSNNQGNLDDENACIVNTEDGILTLQSTVRQKVGISKASIDEEYSNGFPGNSHCADIYSQEIYFEGQQSLHNDLSYIIDSRKDTWFEFELFNITDDTRKACNSLGFDYNEGVSWVTDENQLVLKLTLDVQNNAKCSWISVNPYISDIKGVKPCVLKECQIITKENNILNIANNIDLEETHVFSFPPYEINKIVFTFIQDCRYLTKVGHFYYTSAETTSISYLQEYDDTDYYSRVDGTKPSVNYLNCKYNPKTQWIEYPTSNDEMLDVSFAKENLFTQAPSTIEKKSCVELIDAYRYMIGIRDINISSHVFKESGTYISTVYTTENEITSVTLETEEYIPGDTQEAIEYFISLDGGNNWYKIYPTHRAYNGIYKYYINNDSIENLLTTDRSSKHSKNLSIIGEAHNIQLKISMTRPKEDNEDLLYASPIVYSYKLKLTTGGATIEY